MVGFHAASGILGWRRVGIVGLGWLRLSDPHTKPKGQSCRLRPHATKRTWGPTKGASAQKGLERHLTCTYMASAQDGAALVVFRRLIPSRASLELGQLPGEYSHLFRKSARVLRKFINIGPSLGDVRAIILQVLQDDT